MKRTLVLLTVSISFFWIGSCSSDKDEPGEIGQQATSRAIQKELGQKIDLDNLVINKPPAILRSTEPIILTFQKPVVPTHLVNTNLADNPFTFQPKISGTASWRSPRELRFIPDVQLTAGKFYQGTLDGEKLLGDPGKGQEITFQFKIAEQEILRLEGDFEPVGDAENTVSYTGSIIFAQPVDANSVGKELTCTLDGRRVDVTVTAHNSSEKVKIETAPILRKAEGQNIEFTLPETFTADKKGWKSSIYLAGIAQFRILSAGEREGGESNQLGYEFRFSDLLKKDMDLSGFVSVTPTTKHSVRISGKSLILEGDFQPGQDYTVKIAAGLPSAFKQKLQEPYTSLISFTNLNPEIQWLSEGVYLPTDNHYKLQFKSVNVRRANIRVYEIQKQNVGFFLQNNDLLDQNPSDDNYHYNRNRNFADLKRVAESIYNQRHDLTSERNHWTKTEIDLSGVFRDKPGSVFIVDITFDSQDLCGQCTNSKNDVAPKFIYYPNNNYYANPCRNGYYYKNGAIRKLLISTNVGLTLKQATDHHQIILATDLLTARPMPNVKLGLYNYQNRLIESQVTDKNGEAVFTNPNGYRFYGETNRGVAILRKDHKTWDLTRFDVGGSQASQAGIDVFTYTDRGVHRPGDTIYLTGIVRLERKNPPNEFPVHLVMFNPKRQVVFTSRTNCDLNGMFHFSITTDTKAETGDWQANLQVGGKLFSKTLKVEAVKPVRLKTELDFPEKVFADDLNIRGKVKTRFLFGQPAANLQYKVEARLTSLPLRFKSWSDYTFENPFTHFTLRDLTLKEGKLDSNGVAEINHNLTEVTQAPSLVLARIKSRVNEQGGNFQEQTTYSTIYPYHHFVGVKKPFRRQWIRIGEEYKLPVVVVDTAGNALPNQRVRVRLYLNKRWWWWHYDDRDRKDFTSSNTTYLVSEKEFTTGTELTEYDLKPDDYGQHYLEIKDLNSGHTTGLFFYVSNWGSGPDQSAGGPGANQLDLKLNQEKYAPGDQVTVTFESPSEGMAWLSVEQDTKVFFTDWKPLSPGHTSFTFKTTPEMLPNCYVSISMIQPHGQSENDLPLRVIGIKPVFIEEPKSHLDLRLNAPEKLEPGEDFTMRLTSYADQRVSYTVAVVDEGLLSLTGFKTPMPWDHYFKRVRLAIKSTDNLEEILGALFPDIDKYLSIGGDAMAMAEGAGDLNRLKRLDLNDTKRFKPVVLFQAPSIVEPGDIKDIHFTMPDYIGEVRVMLIATAGDAYTTIERNIPVKQPLMLLTTIPRVVRPGDKFSVPVSIFSAEESIDTVQVQIAVSDNLSLVGNREQTVTFSKTGEKDVHFNLRVGEHLGADTITVTARSKANSAVNVTHLPVSAPNPFYTQVTEKELLRGNPVTFTPRKVGLAGSNAARLSVSRIPDIQLDDRLKRLIRYPYGCIEQTTSAIFPQIYLNFLTDLKPYQKQMVSDLVNAGIARLSGYQTGDGFAYWPGQLSTSEWGSAYTGHFLIEARRLGFAVPDQLYNHWLKGAQSKARRVNEKDHRIQTYRLFLLSLIGKADDGAMNLVRENYLAKLDPLSRRLLAAAYYLSGKQDIAAQIDVSAPTIRNDRELGNTWASPIRDAALMGYLSLKMGDERTAGRLLREVVRKFQPYAWYSTHETAMTLLFIGNYYETVAVPGNHAEFTFQMGDTPAQAMTLTTPQSIIHLENAWDMEIKLTTDEPSAIFLTLYEEGIPLDNRIKTEYNGIELKRNYYDEAGLPIDVSVIEQGAPFWIVFNVLNVNRITLKNVALTCVLPSGWEIMNLRLTGESPPDWIKQKRVTEGDYMDIRDDRVNWFFDLNTNQSGMNFAVKINPTFKGQYRMPPVSVETMYSPEYYARIAASMVTVK
ncbi:MAG: hypothetical protein K9N22_10060 [Candidatus Marinimicrobia bacterium]|nr:hypothetical protein [Candidatus Neomarinimicrobiota bacterium]